MAEGHQRSIIYIMETYKSFLLRLEAPWSALLFSFFPYDLSVFFSSFFLQFLSKINVEVTQPIMFFLSLLWFEHDIKSMTISISIL